MGHWLPCFKTLAITNRNQSEDQDPTWDPDPSDNQSDDSDDYVDASMIPNIGSEAVGINAQELDETSTRLWEPSLEVPASPPTGSQVNFDIGVSTSSTLRPRSSRSTARHDYKRMNEEGL